MKLRLSMISFSLLSLFACSQAEQNIQEVSPQPIKQNIPVVCKQPVKVLDIWKLEPMLLKNGKIKESMTKAEKETVIRQYISKKNGQYKLCTKGLKG